MLSSYDLLLQEVIVSTLGDMTDKQQITWIGEKRFRGDTAIFGIRKPDRLYHMYLIGQTGTGKTTMLQQMIGQDIQNNNGLAFLDPHGDVVERIAQGITEDKKEQVIYLDISNPASPYGFNPLASVPPERRAYAASAMVEAFRKIWEKSWGHRMEHILRNALLTLLEQPQATLADITKLFNEEGFRRQALTRVKNPEVLDFWKLEYERWFPRYRNEAIAPIQNKIGEFLSDPNLRRVITQSDNNLDLRAIMDEGKILLVNLAKGKLGGDVSSLLGSLLVSRIGLAALSRADIQEQERKDFYLYLDEFQSFTTLSLVSMLSELRKYRLSIILSHQYLSQIDPQVRDAILGNVGNIVSFRVGLDDARIMAREFYPDFKEVDFLNISNFNFYMKMMIDGEKSKGFSGSTIDPDGGELPPRPKPYVLDVAWLPSWLRKLWRKKAPPLRVIKWRKPKNRYTRKRRIS